MTPVLDLGPQALVVHILLAMTGTAAAHLLAVLVRVGTRTAMATARGAPDATTTRIVVATGRRLHAVGRWMTTRRLADGTTNLTVATIRLRTPT